jgi:hypothetical protein
VHANSRVTACFQLIVGKQFALLLLRGHLLSPDGLFAFFLLC